MHTVRSIFLALCCALAPLAAGPAAAADYPDKVVRLVVPWATGGFNDILGRMLAERMSRGLGQQVIVENKPGAAGTLGSEFVARAAPDGYTLLLATADTHAISPAVYPNLRYDPVKDFEPVAMLVTQPVLLWVRADSPLRTLDDFLAEAKKRPGELTYASNGNGSATHLGMEDFSRAAGIRMLHVPYKGTGPALIDLMGGRLDTMFLSVQAAGPHGESGALRPLALTAGKRSARMPDVPTLDETCCAGFRLALWQGLVAPKGTPPEVVAKVSQAAVAALQDPEIRDPMAALGVETIGGGPQAFGDFLQQETARWRDVVKSVGVRLE